mgnify:CR=1 FL=1
MLIKLTRKGRPTLINFSNIVTTFVGYDKTQRRMGTTLTFNNGYTLVVDESLQEIYELYQSVLLGEKQTIDWTTSRNTSNLDEEFEQSFNNERW